MKWSKMTWSDGGEEVSFTSLMLSPLPLNNTASEACCTENECAASMNAMLKCKIGCNALLCLLPFAALLLPFPNTETNWNVLSVSWGQYQTVNWQQSRLLGYWRANKLLISDWHTSNAWMWQAKKWSTWGGVEGVENSCNRNCNCCNSNTAFPFICTLSAHSRLSRVLTSLDRCMGWYRSIARVKH